MTYLSASRLPGKRSAKHRVSRAPMLERHRAGRMVHGRKPGGLPSVLTYTLTLKNLSPEEALGNFYTTPYSNVRTLVSFEVETKVVPYNSASIEGNISIESSAKVMPVSMRVAEFYSDTGKRKDKYDATSGEDKISKLDPSKPVWVVVHGRNDNESSGKMLELERALHDSGFQVVSIDWSKAAKSTTVGGEAWIQAVSNWSYNALKAAGFNGDNIRIANHSWGSFVGYEIAENFKNENGFGVDTMIALDSAIDPSLSALYDASQINFKNISRTSTAFWSSMLGSDERANTAHRSIDIRSSLASMLPLENLKLKHGLSVTTFANLVRLKKVDPSNPIGSKFSFHGTQNSLIPNDEGIDGYLYVDTSDKEGSEPGDNYLNAVPDRMTFGNLDDAENDFYFFNTLKTIESTIRSN